ncbi:MAG: polysaccharide deacetylase family protein [Micropepsaceae bacterium]
MKPRLIVTTSWDDGHPSDVRLAELLAKYGIAGTFYVPNRNSEGRPVMTEAELKHLSTAFEVGGHSIDHVVLTDLSPTEAERQIVENKRWLEQVTGKQVRGFCYVRGRYNRTVRDIVERAGFDYARTVANLHAEVTGDPFQMPTTMQLFPHGPITYLKNFSRGQWTPARAKFLWAALASENLAERIGRILDLCETAEGCFHLWGHSWEIDEQNLWADLEAVLRRLSTARASMEFLTNYESHSKFTARKAQAAAT